MKGLVIGNPARENSTRNFSSAKGWNWSVLNGHCYTNRFVYKIETAWGGQSDLLPLLTSLSNSMEKRGFNRAVMGNISAIHNL